MSSESRPDPFRFRRLGEPQVPAWAAKVVGILLPLLLCAGLGAIALSRSLDQYEQRAELLSQNLATALERNVAATVDKIDLALTSVVVQLETQLAGGQIDRPLVDTHLRQQISQRPELEAVRVTDHSGMAILGPGVTDYASTDSSDHPWFLTQRDRVDAGLVMSGPLVNRISGETVLSFSRRYCHPNGTFAGVVAAAVPLQLLARELSAIDAGPHGTVILRDADLGLIVRHPAIDSAAAGRVGDRNVSPELQALALSGRASATYRAARTSDGRARVVAFRRLHVAPMILLVGLSTEDYLVDWYAEVRTVAAFGVAIVVACTMGTVIYLRAQAQNRKSRQRIELLAKAFEHSGEAILITDRHDHIIEVNPAFTRRTGRAASEVIGAESRSLLTHSITDGEIAAVNAALRGRGEWRGELLEIARDGSSTPIWATIATVRDAGGRVSHLVSNSIDLSELKRAEARIVHLAHHDTLTALPNRAQLLVRLELAIASARLDGGELPMLFIDMDRFKNINDTLGHPVGDALLVEVADRLRALVRNGDIVARLGGDEFVLVLGGAGRQGARVAQAVATKVLGALGQPYLVNGHELHSTPSIGVSIYPHDGADVDALMKAADTAMYQAKANGRNNCQFFTDEMRRAGDERLAIEAGLRTAIDRGELLLHYQPQRDLASGRIVGMEALLRWQHPERGMVPPPKFIPVAEDTGLIEPIGAWVIDRALAQVARWRDAIDPRLRVAVNLSAHQLRSAGIVGVVARSLERHGLKGDALELEVTESTAMQDPARTAALLRELRALGVALAIDDFGTGYSSLAYLKRLPLSCLKLDRSFVTDIEHDANDAAISKATIQLAHSLGLAVVAEGVENATQLDFLRALGCDTAQGYLIARPLPPAECERFLVAEAAATAADLAAELV